MKDVASEKLLCRLQDGRPRLIGPGEADRGVATLMIVERAVAVTKIMRRRTRVSMLA